jgi:radical SAM protein (TIGR04043 family)
LVDLALRSQLAVHGLRAEPRPRRASGTGPGDDEHWLIGDRVASIPTTPDSHLTRTAAGELTRDGVVTGTVLAPVARPRFYDLKTRDGVPYEQIARLHGRHVLAATVVQTCVRYDEPTRCRFCTIEESLRAGTTAAVKRPRQLAEVAVAAVRLDGVRQMVLTTGTTAGPDRGAKHLTRCVEAIRRAIPRLPIQIQLEPPAGLGWIARLRQAGATSIGIHVESLDDDVRARWTPGKAAVSLERYEVVWTEAVRVFGRNRVSTYLLVGLGENPDQLVAGAKRLIGMGVYPFIVPYRPLPGSLAHAEGVPAPSHDLVADVTDRVAAALRKARMRGIDQGAGCAACGACSALSTVGG